MAKFTLYVVDDHDLGEVFYASKMEALSHALQHKKGGQKASLRSFVVDDRPFPSRAVLYERLLNRERYGSNFRDLSKEVT